MSTTTLISVKVQPDVKKKAKRLAYELGFSLSSLINGLLKQVIKTRTVTFSAIDETPSDYMIQALKESKKDIKAGRVTSFYKPEQVITYLDKLIRNERSNKKS